MEKKLRKQLLEAKTEEGVKDLKAKMHVAAVDINYTQYCPLSEVYIGLYPQNVENPPKPPLWEEVEKAMKEKDGEGALKRLRNRPAVVPTKPAKQITTRPKVKPPPVPIDTTGMNRRERRRELGIAEPKRDKVDTFEVKRTQSYAIKPEKIAQKAAESSGDEDGAGFFTEG